MPTKNMPSPAGLQAVAYAGANCALIAMSVPDNAAKDLAGFAIWTTFRYFVSDR